MLRSLVALFITAAVSLPATAQSILLDNTIGGTAGLNPVSGITFGEADGSAYSVVFTTPSATGDIGRVTNLRLGFSTPDSLSTDVTLSVKIYSVTEGVPASGFPLAWSVATATVTNNAGYISLGALSQEGDPGFTPAISSFMLAPDTSYALSLSIDASGGNPVLWHDVDPTASPTSPTGFTFGGVFAFDTVNGGWSDTGGAANAITIEFTPVPEPATVGLVAVAGLAFARRRQHRKA